MKTTSPAICAALSALMALLALVPATSTLGASAAAAGDGLELHARFDLAPGQAWSSVQIAAAGWHLMSAAGTPAALAHLRAVPAGPHSVMIGGRCAGWVDGATVYPCGFAVEAVRLGGQPLAARPLRAFGTQRTPKARARSEAQATNELRAASLRRCSTRRSP